MSKQRLRQISELCEGQAADHRKSVAEIMAEHIWVKEERIQELLAHIAAQEAAIQGLTKLLSEFDLTDEEGNVCDEDGEPYPDDYHLQMGWMQVAGVKEIHAALASPAAREGAGDDDEG